MVVTLCLDLPRSVSVTTSDGQAGSTQLQLRERVEPHLKNTNKLIGTEVLCHNSTQYWVPLKYGIYAQINDHCRHRGLLFYLCYLAQ
jgi:hypothetical protein